MNGNKGKKRRKKNRRKKNGDKTGRKSHRFDAAPTPMGPQNEHRQQCRRTIEEFSQRLLGRLDHKKNVLLLGVVRFARRGNLKATQLEGGQTRCSPQEDANHAAD